MALYDAYGRKVEPAALAREQARPTMAGVRNIYSVTHPSVGLTPERLFAVLSTAEFGDPFLYLELAEEMEEKDLHYLAVLNTRKATCAQLDLIVKPASSAAVDQRAADLVRACLRAPGLDLESILFDVLDAIGKGFSATEIVWDRQGPEWTPERLVWRDPKWFMFDWIGGSELLVRTLRDEQSIDPSRGESDAAHFKKGWSAALSGIQPLTAPLAPFKFLVHVAKAKSGLPIRGGVARAAAWSWLFKNFLLKDWLGYSEVYGQPVRVGKYGPGASEQDKQTLLQAVTNIGADAAAVIPESMAIEFEQARAGVGAGGDLYMQFCEYLDAQVSKAVLGQTLTTELPRAGGSRAAAMVHEMVRRDILAADARRLASTLTRDLVKPIVDLNLGEQSVYPRVSLGLPDDIDDKVFADIIGEMADRGLEVGQGVVRDRLGLPDPAPREKLLHPKQTITEKTGS